MLSFLFDQNCLLCTTIKFYPSYLSFSEKFSLILRTLITSLSERSLSRFKKASNGRSRPHFLLLLCVYFASFVRTKFFFVLFFIVEEKDGENFHRKTTETFFIFDIRFDDDEDDD